MKTHFAVAAVLKFEDKILILKKSEDDYNYPRKWSFVAGYAKEFEPAEQGILREIKEETGIEAKIIKKGKVLEIIDKNIDKTWMILPFLCEADADKVKLCHENIDFRWIYPENLDDYDQVPGLHEDLKMFDME